MDRINNLTVNAAPVVSPVRVGNAFSRSGRLAPCTTFSLQTGAHKDVTVERSDTSCDVRGQNSARLNNLTSKPAKQASSR